MSLSSLFVHGVSFMMTTEYNELGAVHIADKVIAGIAVEAALAVKGVAGPAASFAEKFGRSSSPRGIDIKTDGTTVELTVRLVVRYGIRIPDVARTFYMTARQQKKVDRMETNEEKVYTVSQTAMEKIVRTAVAGTTGVAAKRKIHVTVHRKEDELAVAIRLTALPEAQMRELALAVQHHTAQSVKDMIGPDKVTVDVTIEDMIAHQTV